MKPIDSHFHVLSMLETSPDIDLDIVLNSISGGIDIGTDSNDLEKRFPIISQYPHIKYSASMGPWETLNTDEKQINKKFEQFKKNIAQYKPQFLGEFGLDNYQNYGSKELQEHLMHIQMQYAAENNFKVIIHNREADTQTVKILSQYPNVNGIIHCFSGNIEVLQTALELGYYISYAGNITYKSSTNLQKTLLMVPKNRLLLETDSPFLSPTPKRGQPNSPLNICYTYEYVADYLKISTEELSEQISQNFNTLLSQI